MPAKRLTPRDFHRLLALNRVLSIVNQVLCVAVALGVGSLVLAAAVPHWHELEALKTKLKETEERAREVANAKEHRRIILDALRSDPAYLEIEARDRLNLQKPGERILRFSTCFEYSH